MSVSQNIITRILKNSCQHAWAGNGREGEVKILFLVALSNKIFRPSCSFLLTPMLYRDPSAIYSLTWSQLTPYHNTTSYLGVVESVPRISFADELFI